MGKHSRCIISICDNDMQYSVLHKKYSTVDEYIIMHKLPKDGAIREAWICAIFKGRKQVVQESIIFVTASLPG